MVEFDADWRATTRFLPSSPPWPSDYALELIRHGDVYYVLRRQGIYRSTDLESWSEVLAPPQILTAMASNGEEILAVGFDGYVYSSTDGQSWSTEKVSLYDLNVVVWGGSGPMVAGEEGEVLLRRGPDWETLDLWRGATVEP